MQAEIFQPEGKWIIPKTQLTSFSDLFIYTRVGISRSASETDVRFCLSFIQDRDPSSCKNLGNLLTKVNKKEASTYKTSQIIYFDHRTHLYYPVF